MACTHIFLADPAIDLVVVTTSTSSHAPVAEAALHAGKHVLVEKPFTTSSASANQLIALAKSKNLVLTVYQNRRWDSEFLTLSHLVQEKKALGELTDVQIHYDVPFPAWIQGWTDPQYSEGEGMMFGLGSHSIDQALLLLGRPSRVTGWIRSLRGVESEVDDTFTVVLEYEGRPVMCTVKTTVVNVMRDPLKYFVRGREGTFVKFGECRQEEHSLKGMKATDDGFGRDEEPCWGELTTNEKVDNCQTKDEKTGKWIGRYPTKTGYWRGLYENVVAAIRGEAELQVKPEQSRDGIRVMELARQSWKEGRTVPWS
ncbi:uncharacterized protein HMPREF1541_05001 [Cyphellophora europaea CBS 101466]|uniref:Gfo/Idh/MocA-like oxidoreductase N-terminal domain-containing protein n=1 Tax=Cyphellophora europaea (strain CBS 101466) TaxID=1220924 RepID=W2RW20_CYPE1|nr:uncharacterized protein HMPREF1541_05001 [Cyphellophora europaea CBS 101466]ETN40721.1 hypothetical protein HMPREF1541_05001 [Cyphellophora europaea CBS 101466]